MKQASLFKSVADWRIALRPGMVAPGHSQIKVFTSATAFDGYVRELRARAVVVAFSSPFAAACEGVA